MSDRTHYVVDIHVKRVDVTKEKEPDQYGRGGQTGMRTVSTVAHIVVSDESLDDLKARVVEHIALVSDGGEIA